MTKKAKKNSFRTEGLSTFILLNSLKYGPMESVIDTEDIDRVKCFSWRYCKTSSGCYVRGDMGRFNIKLHRLITSFEWSIVDHKDGNPLNNKKNNLRAATSSENSRNRSGRKDTITKTKGVRVNKATGNFVARINFGGKQIHLGTFKTIEEATNCYDRNAQNLFGGFAKLNNPLITSKALNI